MITLSMSDRIVYAQDVSNNIPKEISSQYQAKVDALEKEWDDLNAKYAAIEKKYGFVTPELTDAQYEEMDKEYQKVDSQWDDLNAKYAAIEKKYGFVTPELTDAQYEEMDKEYMSLDKEWERLDKQTQTLNDEWDSIVKKYEN